MWYLEETAPAATPAPRYWLGGISSAGRTIGRKNVHIRIKTPSVSRTHATVRVSEASSYLLSNDDSSYVRSTSVHVEDASAYGTFVQYPPDHTGERGGLALDGYTRLNKKIPAEVHPGAQLAFGAPSNWWNLQWHPILCYIPPYESSKKTIGSAAKGAGMDISNTYFAGITTHIVVSKVDITCFSILNALVNGLHIVTPAWVSSVQHTAKEACKLISEAQNNDAALAAAKLAAEDRFKPALHDDTIAEYPEDALDKLFIASDSIKEKRKGLFKNKVFAFVNKNTRSKWKDLLKNLGARTLVAGSLNGKNRDGMIIVEDSDGKGSRKRKNADKITEKSIILALLTADESHVLGDTASEEEEEDSEEAEEEAEDVQVEKRRSPPKKKKNDNNGSTTNNNNKARSVNAEGIELLKKQREMRNNEPVSAEDANERVFVKINAPRNAPSNDDTGRTFSEHDVRRFRRKNFPQLAQLPLKRVKYMEEEEEFVSSSKNAGRKKGGRGAKSASNISDVDD